MVVVVVDAAAVVVVGVALEEVEVFMSALTLAVTFDNSDFDRDPST